VVAFCKGWAWQSLFLDAQEAVRAVAEARHECAGALDRTRSELAKIRSATQAIIIESRLLTTDADAAIARR
jgi:hypothetical protein